ncbi:hypothetical protein [Kitasatospora acidiphila]|uniref:hypothetical protein n=1 Tax=Kitasatospora acidiphila TaxID=2567942 RepID=UPI0015F00443|nr:hypothetical protein [Kitasatospora acidiphila]
MTSAEYQSLLRSYSGHRVLAPAARAALLGCLGNLIDRRHGGRITKRCPTRLLLARRLS